MQISVSEKTKRLCVLAFAILFSLVGIMFGVYLFIIAPTLYAKILALAFCALIALATFFNVAGAAYFYFSYYYVPPLPNVANNGGERSSKAEEVAIVVTSYNESVQDIIRTLESLKKIKWPNYKIYLLDDTTKEENIRALRKFCAQAGIKFVHYNREYVARAARMPKDTFIKFAKLNLFIKNVKAPYIAFFDADEVLIDPQFLNETIPLLREKGIAYVQTAKRYANGSLFANAVDSTHAFFSSFVQPCRAFLQIPLFVGSCGVIRTDVLKRLGGFPSSVVEDAAFSLRALSAGWRGIYIGKVYALGKPIENYTSFASQQWRYNYGNTKLIPQYFNYLKKSNILAAIHNTILIFGLHYISIVLFLFSLLTLLLAFTNFESVQMAVSKIFLPISLRVQLEFLALFGIISTLFMCCLMAKAYFGSFRLGFVCYFLNFALIFIRIKAALAACFERFRKALTVRKFGHGVPALAALRATALESSYAMLLIAAAIVSLLNSDISSAFWLSWYGAAFSSAFFFVWKTG